MTGPTSREAIRQAAELLAQMRSVHLASVNGEAAPLASYAPFVQFDGALYVYLSSLAQHVHNVRSTPLLSAMLIRDEASCDEIFARPRLVLDCLVTEHARDDALFNVVLDRFESSFGATASTVRELTDFSLFRLCPHRALLVSGFAQAVHLDNHAMSAIFGTAFSAPPTDGNE